MGRCIHLNQQPTLLSQVILLYDIVALVYQFTLFPSPGNYGSGIRIQ